MSMRTMAKKEMQSMPDYFRVLTAGNTFQGTASGVAVFKADFPDNTTSIKLGGVGVNLSDLNDVVCDGYELKGHFTYIQMPLVTDMVLIVYS
jgi:hypothetical protein